MEESFVWHCQYLLNSSASHPQTNFKFCLICLWLTEITAVITNLFNPLYGKAWITFQVDFRSKTLLVKLNKLLDFFKDFLTHHLAGVHHICIFPEHVLLQQSLTISGEVQRIRLEIYPVIWTFISKYIFGGCEHHLVLLCLREGRHLYGRYLQNKSK